MGFRRVASERRKHSRHHLRFRYESNFNRGDRTAIELFVAGVSVWEARLQRSVGRMGIEVDHPI
jgi:hypothetical protein